MKVAIVGSREFPDLDMVRRYVMELPHDTIIVSGGAKGVDSVAVKSAEILGMEVIVHLPDWSKGKGAGFARNTLIIDDADLIRAFWDGVSHGTYDSIKKTLKAGKNLDLTVRFAGQPAFSLYGPNNKS